MARQKTTPEEIKQALKKEIIRLGIQDNPSRTVYQKKYERGVAPSPNNAIKVTGMKWQELMLDLGFEYDGKKNSGAKDGRDYTALKATRYNYDDPEIRKEIMDRVVNVIRKNNYTKPIDLEKNLKNKIGISYITLKRHGFKWEDIIVSYKGKYGKPVVPLKQNERMSWSQLSNKELLDIVTKIVIDHKFKSINDYRVNMTGKKIAPSIPTLNKRFGTTDIELWRMIQINGDLPIK